MARKNIDNHEEGDRPTFADGNDVDRHEHIETATATRQIAKGQHNEMAAPAIPPASARKIRILPHVNSLESRRFEIPISATGATQRTTSVSPNKARATPAGTAKRTVAYRDAIEIQSDSSDGSDVEVSTFCQEESSESDFDSDASITSPAAWPRARSNALSPRKKDPQETRETVQDGPRLKMPISKLLSAATTLADNPLGLAISDKENRRSAGLQTKNVPVRPQTPPASPTKNRLTSPSKPRIRVPTPPGRPSLDNFWDMGEVNDWNDRHSPKKPLASPSKHRLLYPEAFGQPRFSSSASSDDAEPQTPPRKSPPKVPQRSPGKASPKKSSVVKSKAATQARKDFNARKERLAIEFLAELDDKITQGRISAATAATGGIKIVWSNTLNSTAGRASWKREAIRARPDTTTTPDPESSISSSSNGSSSSSDSAPCPPPAPATYKHHATIELATKVLTDATRLRNTLAHEFSHLCVYILDHHHDHQNHHQRQKPRPHGPEFKAWAARCSRAFADRDVRVTTRHGYEIEFRYLWICVGNSGGGGGGGEGDRHSGAGDAGGCGAEFGRHSKSIDPAKQRCGTCKGALVQVRPAPRGGGGRDGSGVGKARTGEDDAGDDGAAAAGEKKKKAPPGGFAGFVKEEMAAVRKEMEATTGAKVKHAEVMSELGRRWRARKQESAAAVGELDAVQELAEKPEPSSQDAVMNKVLERIAVIELSDDDE